MVDPVLGSLSPGSVNPAGPTTVGVGLGLGLALKKGWIVLSLAEAGVEAGGAVEVEFVAFSVSTPETGTGSTIPRSVATSSGAMDRSAGCLDECSDSCG